MDTPLMPIPERKFRRPSWVNGEASSSDPPTSSSSTWSQRSLSHASSTNSTYSTNIWQKNPKQWRMMVSGIGTPQMPRLSGFCHCRARRKGILLVLLMGIWITISNILPVQHDRNTATSVIADDPLAYQPLRPELPASEQKQPDPIAWLRQNSMDKYAVTDTVVPHISAIGGSKRPRAALISLVRNSELAGIVQSMRQLEYSWNMKYQYPWVFFNDEPFTEEFIATTRNLTASTCYYEIVPKEHWSLPSWIDDGRFMNSLEYLGTIGVGKGWMVSYHHMCRWNSGFFYKHPRLKDFDWYWRVEPDVHYFCDIDYDVFRFMSDNGLKYGFNMNILDDARSFPSLWAKTKSFAAANPKLLHPEADLSWLLDGNENYNNCQFFSNFEIGSLSFWRSKASEAYFQWLDQSGGFYYERWGDAPVHTLAVAMFLAKREVWFFRDMGYRHNVNTHCPPRKKVQCACEPTSLDANFYTLVPTESPYWGKKPDDTCIRQWLGGKWLTKRDGWTKEGELGFGADGYHGYENW